MSVYDRCKVCGLTRYLHASDGARYSHVFVSPRHKERHEKRRAVLKSWRVIDSGSDGHDLRLHLEGCVYGHETFVDGYKVQTSPLLRLDIPAREAETLNTVYLLG